MGDERAIAAISRIERALGRIEASAGRRPASSADQSEIRRLREANQALRGRVQAAISEIDRMLASGETG